MTAILTDEMVDDLCKEYSGSLLEPADLIQAAARLGAEIEREACAKVCEEMQDGLNDHYDAGCYQCASAIRDRAGKEGNDGRS